MRFPWLIPLAADFLAVVTAYFTTYFLRFHSDPGEALFEIIPALLGFPAAAGSISPAMQAFYLHSAFRIILIVSIVLFTLYALRNLYDGRRFLVERPMAWDIFISNAIALALFYSYWYLQRNIYHPRSFFASMLVLNIVFCLAYRHLATALLNYMRGKYKFDQCRALIAGDGDEARFIEKLLELRQPHGIYAAATLPLPAGQTVDEQLQAISAALDKHKAEMLICAGLRLTVADMMRILELTQDAGIPAKILSTQLNVLITHARLPCDMIHGVPLVHFDAPGQVGGIGIFRRLLTLIIAGGTLVVATPVMLLITLLIRVTSNGPAVFVQERIGVNRKPFNLYKFRTMHTHAEQLQSEIEALNESSGALFKIRQDPRITPLGRVLRRFSLDELPQLINVLKGEMVIVGPRPLPRRDFENYYEQWHYSRHSGLPGLTCLWQISGRSNISFHNMCILDVYYLRNHNWVLDLKIAIRTIRVVLFGEGAY